MHNFIQDYMVSTQYFAPRGKERLLFLGEQISHRHINFNDLQLPVDRLKSLIGRVQPSETVDYRCKQSQTNSRIREVNR